jgi:hypothetical protein
LLIGQISISSLENLIFKPLKNLMMQEDFINDLKKRTNTGSIAMLERMSDMSESPREWLRRVSEGERMNKEASNALGDMVKPI